MKVWRKFTAVAFALVMMLAISAVASASSANLTSTNGGVYGAFDTQATPPTNASQAGNTITFVKELKMYNPSQTAVDIYPPTISYTYTIAAGSADKSITDKNGVAVKTKAGPVIGSGENQKPLITTTATWNTDAPVSASSSGVASTKTITVDFTDVTFGAAGVYRYVITETNAETDYTRAGVTDGGSNVRYLDVYVMDDANNASNQVIYGYVLSTDDDAALSSSNNTTKTEGFIGDSYYTYNLSVTKQVEKDNYNATSHHPFPFTVTFTNATNEGSFRIASAVSGTSTSLATLSASTLTSGFNTSPLIADDGTVIYRGIPLNTAVAIVEQNDVTGATYGVASTGGDAQITQTITENTSTSSVTVLNAHTIADEVAITVTNTLALISPTGVTLRYAPYLAMMGVGIVALPLSIRRKKEDF